MNLLGDTSLLEAPMDILFHLPETVERILFPHSQNGGAHHRHRAGDKENHRGNQNDGNGFGNVAVDIVETPKDYTFILDVPGLSKSDIQVSLEEGEKVLVIKSIWKRKRDEGEDEGGKYLRLERKASPKFTRKFRLPQDANSEAITAKCELGVLTVAVEKLPELKPKTVQVAIA